MLRFLALPFCVVLPAMLPAAPAIGMKGDGSTAADVEAGRVTFGTWLGRPAQYYVGFTSTDTWGSGFISMDFWKGRWAQLNVPVIISIPLTPLIAGGTENEVAEVAAGDHDSSFSTAATSLTTWRTGDAVIYIRLGWECNGTWYNWSPGFPTNTVSAADFIAAFQRVAQLMTAIEPRLRFVQNFTARTGTSAAAEALYAGDTDVDVVSIDAYWDVANPTPASGSTQDRETAATTNWNGTKTLGAGMDWFFAFQTDKPHAIDEWGAQHDGGPWVDGMAAIISVNAGNILWHCYWDSDSGYTAKISDNGGGTTSVRFLANFSPVSSPSRSSLLLLFP